MSPEGELRAGQRGRVIVRELVGREVEVEAEGLETVLPVDC